MIAEKIAIAISKNRQGKYTIQVIGINGDRVVNSAPDLEQIDVSFATASRVVDRLWTTVKLRLNRGLMEFAETDERPER